MSADDLGTIAEARAFVAWYRHWTIEGRIKTEDYAKKHKPVDDYKLYRSLGKIIEREAHGAAPPAATAS